MLTLPFDDELPIRRNPVIDLQLRHDPGVTRLVVAKAERLNSISSSPGSATAGSVESKGRYAKAGCGQLAIISDVSDSAQSLFARSTAMLPHRKARDP